jgi:hypothetical protein
MKTQKIHKELEEIAKDLVKSLGFYLGSYKGSPFSETAEKTLDEYLQYLESKKWLNTVTLTGWDSLEGKIVSLPSDEDKPLSLVVQQAKEIVELVKRIGMGKDVDDKLDSVIKYINSLKS